MPVLKSIIKRSFSRFPFPAWILVIIALLIVLKAFDFCESQKLDEARLAKEISIRFNAKYGLIQTELDSFKIQQSNFFLKGKENTELCIFLFKDKNIIDWNCNRTYVTEEMLENAGEFTKGKIVHLNNTIYYLLTKISEPKGDSIKFIFTPLAQIYPVENQYFRSDFLTGTYIPKGTTLLNNYNSNSYTILKPDGEIAFYVQFPERPFADYSAHPLSILLYFSILIIICIWIHKTGRSLCEQLGSGLGYFITITLVVFFLFLIDYFGYPFGISKLYLYSPELMTPSLFLSNSFGSFIIVILVQTWMLIFALSHVHFQKECYVKNKVFTLLIKYISIILFVATGYYTVTKGINALMLDSKISFEINDFSELDIYTFLGIFITTFLIINFILCLNIGRLIAKTIWQKKLYRNLFISSIGIITALIIERSNTSTFTVTVLLLMVACLLLLDDFRLPFLTKKRTIDLTPNKSGYIWFIALGAWVSFHIFYFNLVKEKEIRKVFASKQISKKDPITEFNLTEINEKIKTDSVVKDFFYRSTEEKKALTDKYLMQTYVKGDFNDYAVTILYFNKDTLSILPIDKGRDKSRHKWIKNNYNEISYLGEFAQNLVYQTCVAIKDSNGNISGFVSLELNKNQNGRYFSPELLKGKYGRADQYYFDRYSYRIYKDKKLVKQQIFNYSYPDYKINTSNQEYKFDEKLYYSILTYKPSKNIIIEVYYKRDILTGLISLFSYVLAVMVLTFALFYLLIFIGTQKDVRFFKRFHFTLSNKINLTILGTVFISFIVIGVISINFLVKRHKEDQKKYLLNQMELVSKAVTHTAEEFFEANEPIDYRNLDENNHLNSTLSYLTSNQSIDINLYAPNGLLVATSQSELFRKGYVSPIMNRQSYESLQEEISYPFSVNERIGTLEYLSYYGTLKHQDKVVGFINIANYTSGIGLKSEISNMLVALINIYTFIFFLSVFASIIITNNVINSFRLLISQFRLIRLSQNEQLIWPYHDEIGVLVLEYNAMIRKVENMAKKLARSERENAWREIAQQVAHEIKNPLTPMKLNIQYLQMAIKTQREDLPELAFRVSNTLIEQIDNLTVIASEFSNFAKMPDANPEVFNLFEAINSLIHLFQKEEKVIILFPKYDQSIMVKMDKSYFIRSLTNLIKNAIQAISSANKEGIIEISFYQEIQEHDYVTISIKDNGPGIPEELLDKLFVPYFTTKSAGTGLGLSMTKSMIEISNGSIWFKSTSNTGTTFFVSLPIHR